MAAAILLFYWWGIRYVRQGEEGRGNVTLGPSH